MPRPRSSLLSLFLVASLAVAGCGGGGGDDAAGGGDTENAGSIDGGEGSQTDEGGRERECGGHDVNGVTVMTHCGPASAEVVVGGQTFSFEGGSCERGRTHFTINVGSQVLSIDSGEFQQHYFGLVAGDITGLGGGGGAGGIGAAQPVTGDGPYTDEILITWVEGPVDGSVAGEDAEIVFSGDVGKGTFKGTGSGGAAGEVTGSFDCGD